MGLLKDFRDFAMRGNVIDLAIGVVIGAAFGKIVDSLVKDVIMPPLGLLISGVDFSRVVVRLGPDVTLNIGMFINALIQFIIIAFTIFLLSKAIKRLNRKKDKEAAEAAAAEAAKPSNEEKLLAEIRDILKNK